jgi:hypothetical protein
MKLKTLNDIIPYYNISNDGSFVDIIDKNELKQEAIKWLKSDKSNFYSREGMENTKDWIKYFFNISDKEVKK